MTRSSPIVLLTRPQLRAERFAAQLAARGVTAKIVIAPLQVIDRTKASGKLTAEEAAIFTAATAVELVPRQAVTAYCVGAYTTECATAAGWQAICGGSNVAQLIDRLVRTRPSAPLVHLRGAHSRGDLAKQLNAAGLKIREEIIYHQRAIDLTSEGRACLSGEAPVIVPLFSPRSAQLFAGQSAGNAPLWGVAMSAAVAESMNAASFARLHIAKAPTARSMVDGIISLLGAA